MRKYFHFSFFVIFLNFFAFSAFFCGNVESLYQSSSPVKVLNAKQFREQVIGSHDLWIVEFFAPWCGHCKQFAPQYEKAASALKGIVKVVAVEDESIMGEFKVKGFPTVKAVIGMGKDKTPKTVDFKANRDADSVVSFALDQIKSVVQSRLPGRSSSSSSSKKKSGPSDVVVLTDKNFDELVMGDEAVWFVEFYAPWCAHCQRLTIEWEGLATKVKGKVKIGKVDATTERLLAEKFHIKGYPTLKLFPAGKKSVHLVEVYDGQRETDALVEFAMKYYVVPHKLEQLLSEQQFRDTCGSGVCIISFLPHILDSKTEGRNAYLDVVKQVIKGSATTPVQFLWAQGGDHYEMEEKMNLAFGYPAVVAVHLEKRKYGVHRGAFTHEAVKKFLIGLMAGKVPLDEIRNMEPLKTVDSWDGKDAKVEEETNDEL